MVSMKKMGPNYNEVYSTMLTLYIIDVLIKVWCYLILLHGMISSSALI